MSEVKWQVGDWARFNGWRKGDKSVNSPPSYEQLRQDNVYIVKNVNEDGMYLYLFGDGREINCISVHRFTNVSPWKVPRDVVIQLATPVQAGASFVWNAPWQHHVFWKPVEPVEPKEVFKSSTTGFEYYVGQQVRVNPEYYCADYSRVSIGKGLVASRKCIQLFGLQMLHI